MKINNKTFNLQKNSIYIELTTRCNNNCSHCVVTNPNVKNEYLLTTQEIMRIIDEIDLIGYKEVIITGGEPLLRTDIIEIIKYIYEKNLKINIMTNGTLLDETIIEKLKIYNKLLSVTVSLYGYNEESYYNFTKNKIGFNDVIRGLSLLKINKIKYKINVILIREIIDNFESLKNILFENKLISVLEELSFIGPLYTSNTQSERMNEQIIQLRVSPREYCRALFLIEKDSGIYEYKANSMSNDKIFNCGFCHTISPDGYFRYCLLLNDKDENCDLKKYSLLTVLQSKNKLLELSISDDDYKQTCYRCKYKNFCSLCPAISYMETGRYDKRIDYFCRLTLEEVKQRERLFNER